MDSTEGSTLLAQLEIQAGPIRDGASLVESVATKMRAEQAEKEVSCLCLC